MPHAGFYFELRYVARRPLEWFLFFRPVAVISSLDVFYRHCPSAPRQIRTCFTAIVLQLLDRYWIPFFANRASQEGRRSALNMFTALAYLPGAGRVGVESWRIVMKLFLFPVRLKNLLLERDFQNRVQEEKMKLFSDEDFGDEEVRFCFAWLQ